jgi:rRNA-processing protein FCF1
MLLQVVRLFYLAVVLAFAWPVAVTGALGKEHSEVYVVMVLLGPVLLAAGLVIIDLFWKTKHLQAMSGLFFGLLAGLAIAYVLGQTVDLVSHVYIERTPTVATDTGTDTGTGAGTGENAPPAPKEERRHSRAELPPDTDTTLTPADRLALLGLLKAFLGASAVYLCVSFILQTKDDFRFVIPYVEFSKQTKGARPILLDTSVIIDGRIADIAETRILESEILVPRFILSELQAISDSDDKLKRNRGRRGLDILNKLRTNPKVTIRLPDAQVAEVEAAPDVDAKLVALAKHLDGRVVTNDYNLNKVAQLRGVDVININDLANALKPVVLPGEGMTIKIIKPGEESGQGVGYLEDGTMVVAEGGREHIGKEITISVTSVLQTSAGRMIFGRFEGADKPPIRRDRR